MFSFQRSRIFQVGGVKANTIDEKCKQSSKANAEKLSLLKRLVA